VGEPRFAYPIQTGSIAAKGGFAALCQTHSLRQEKPRQIIMARRSRAGFAAANAPGRIRTSDVGDHDLVFPNVAGNPIDPSAFRRRYKAAIKRAARSRSTALRSWTCRRGWDTPK
jgi:hypothetical protein